MAKKKETKEKKPAQEVNKEKKASEAKKSPEKKTVPDQKKVPEKKETKPSPTGPDEVRQRKQSENKQENSSKPAPVAREKSPPAQTKWSPRQERKQKQAKAAKQREQKRERRQERIKEKKVKKVPPAVNHFWVTYLRPWCRRHYILVTSSIALVFLLFALFLAKDTMDKQQQQPRFRHPTVTDKVTFHVNINNETSGDLVLGLYGKDCPLTVENFVKLSTHEVGYGYKGTKIHTVFPGHMLIGGDVVFNNGTGGRSAITENFEEENLKLRHLSPGTLGMVGLKNNNDSSRSSQFYITFGEATGFDGIAVVFGRILEGLEFLKKIGKVEVVGKSMRPNKLIVIEDAIHEKA